jgi:tocopherol cyclase
MKTMVFESFRKIRNPEFFQGTKNRKHYFEGWYFKLVDASEKQVLAVIPGIALGETEEDSHAFIQVLNGKTGDFDYYTFSIDDFIPAKKGFEVYIGKNYFSADSLKVDLTNTNHTIRGELRFENVVSYPKKFFSPGFMGWSSFIPFMQCKHAIVSMNHTLQGALEIDGERIPFDGGKGYSEKDWGHSFPSSYIWMQSNHFTNDDVSFMLALARIPWLHFTITGFGAVLWYNGRFHTFATYTGAKITHFEKGDKWVRLRIEDKRFVLNIEGIQDIVWELKSPARGTMTESVCESLTATLSLKFYAKTKSGKRLIFEASGRNAGLEIMDAKDAFLRDLNR